MDTGTVLRQIVAEFFETELGQIGPDFVLTGSRLQGSLGRARLDAAIRRRAGVRCPAAYTARSYGELEAAVLGKAVTPVPSLSSPEESSGGLDDTPVHPDSPPSRSPISCGIDIELIDNLPSAKDFWEEDFYRTYFTPTEIAFCLTKENPRVHFAARWSAKEALKKCDPAFLGVEMSDIELTVDEMGAPALRHIANGSATVLPFAVSISHTPTVAAAIVLKVALEPGLHSQPAEKQGPLWVPMDNFPRNRYGAVPALLTGLALGLALWGLVRTFF